MFSVERQDKIRMLKLLRQKGQEFLESRKSCNHLVDIVKLYESGVDASACILTFELIFTNLLKDGTMYQETVPLKPAAHTPENKHKEWLRAMYDGCFTKIIECFSYHATKVQQQAMASAMKLIAYEGMYPLDAKSNLPYPVPVHKLKALLTKMFNSPSAFHLSNKFEEFLIYDDLLFYTWKSLPGITAKSNPTEAYHMNYLRLLQKLHVTKNEEPQLLCCSADEFTFDLGVTKRCLNKVWNCLMLWEHTPQTHKQLLLILLEHVLEHLEKPLLMTDFLMDSLDAGGVISLLALQGIFTMIQMYNLDYPNIFSKLYSMFEPEIFHTKFKSRLYYLADIFLSSTHLPEVMVAAFAKRLSRLALVAPSEDVIIICMFVGNLILRHPGLKFLLNRSDGGSSSEDPYVMEERDPVQSNALSSCLWEIKTLQNHAVPEVTVAAKIINSPLPTVEWDITKFLDETDDIFDKEIKKNHKLIAMAFDRPDGFVLNRHDILSQYWTY